MKWAPGGFVYYLDGKEWNDAVSWFLERIPENIVLGLYECPIPYKHLITDSEMEFIVSTGRFAFLKGTALQHPSTGPKGLPSRTSI